MQGSDSPNSAGGTTCSQVLGVRGSTSVEAISLPTTACGPKVSHLSYSQSTFTPPPALCGPISPKRHVSSKPNASRSPGFHYLNHLHRHQPFGGIFLPTTSTDCYVINMVYRFMSSFVVAWCSMYSESPRFASTP